MTTIDPITSQVPTAWASYVPILASLVRGLLNVLGGVGFTWALTVNASQIQMAVSAGLIVASLVWSAVQKLQAARASHDSSVASAQASAKATALAGVATPVTVATQVTP